MVAVLKIFLRHPVLQNTGDSGDKIQKPRIHAGYSPMAGGDSAGDKAGTQRGQIEEISLYEIKQVFLYSLSLLHDRLPAGFGRPLAGVLSWPPDPATPPPRRRRTGRGLGCATVVLLAHIRTSAKMGAVGVPSGAIPPGVRGCVLLIRCCMHSAACSLYA